MTSGTSTALDAAEGTSATAENMKERKKRHRPKECQRQQYHWPQQCQQQRQEEHCGQHYHKGRLQKQGCWQQ